MAAEGEEARDGAAGFGAALRELRVARGLTQRQAAAACGRAMATISQWETGTHAPTRLADVSQVAAALGATEEERNRLLGAVRLHDQRRKYALHPTARRHRTGVERAVREGVLGDAVGGTLWSLWRALEAANNRATRSERRLDEERQESRRLRDRLRAAERQAERLADGIAAAARASPPTVARREAPPRFDPPADFAASAGAPPTGLRPPSRPSLRDRLAAKNAPTWQAAGDLDAGTRRDGRAA